MNITQAPTYQITLYLSGPIEIAKQTIRETCAAGGLCVTIEPTTYVFRHGEESGYRVGILNYPRFPESPEKLRERASELCIKLLNHTHQGSALMVTPEESVWFSVRPE